MKSVEVYVTNVLRVDGNMLGPDLTNEIFDALTIDNMYYIKAKARKQWGWQKLSQFHEPFELDGDELVLPRGYALSLKQLLRKHGIKVKWIDRTRWKRRLNRFGPEQFSYRDHQPAAVKAIKRHRQGIYKAPTSSGKTGVVCGLIWDLSPLRTLILVDKINLISQWATEIDMHIDLRFEATGYIGQGKWYDEASIVVATIQTLWSKRHEIDDDWWEKWDLVVLDECHHVTAETIDAVMGAFTARYRIGVSATPDKTGEFELAQAVLGPIFHEDSHNDLRDAGILIKPTIKVIYSGFQFEYWGDHKADKKGRCEIPWCKNPKPYHQHRNNYQKLLGALVEDESRNGLILEILKREADHTVLVCTDRTKHISAMLNEIASDGWIGLYDVYVLTGKQQWEQRDEIINTVIKRGHGIILSTIANEALNLPSIDRIVLAFPTRNAKKTEQQVGRGTRVTGGKDGCLVYDIADDVGPLYQQLQSRVAGCYRPLELEVEYINQPVKKKGLGRLLA